jgi:hypothetical protein
MSSFQSMWKHENLSSLRQYTIHIIHNENRKKSAFFYTSKNEIWNNLIHDVLLIFFGSLFQEIFCFIYLKMLVGKCPVQLAVMKYQTGWFIKFFFTIVDYIVFFWRDKCAKLIRWQIEITLDKKFIVFVVTLVIIKLFFFVKK